MSGGVVQCVALLLCLTAVPVWGAAGGDQDAPPAAASYPPVSQEELSHQLSPEDLDRAYQPYSDVGDRGMAAVPLKRYLFLRNFLSNYYPGIDGSSPFSRSYAPSFAEPSSTSLLGKRQTFSSWAGKRNLPFSDRNFVVNLRSFLQNKLLRRDLGSKRQQFSAWAGKRSGENNSNSAPSEVDNSAYEDEDTAEDYSKGTKNVHDEVTVDSHQQKRADVALGTADMANLAKILSLIRDGNNERMPFNAWSGKRSFSAWAGKRAFSAWAGK